MKTKPKVEASGKWKSHFLASSRRGADDTNSSAELLQGSLSVACDCEMCFRHLFLAGEALACVCQSRVLSAIKHLKTLVPSWIRVSAEQHTLICWSFLCTSGSSFCRHCLFMPLYVVAFGLPHKTENTLKFISFTWACHRH